MKSSERQDVLASPYRGIHPFRYVDQAYFFGREETVGGLLAKVLVSRLVLLFGESGTGKSSLINAGLIPALEKEGLSPERLRVRPIPGEPILIERIPAEDEDDSPFLPSVFVDEKSVDTGIDGVTVPCSLERFLKTIREADAYPVLIFDQFEELFTLFAQDRDKAVTELLDAIFQIVNNESLRVKVVITIREDFLGKLEILAKNYPQVFDHRVRLGHLDQSGARKAILGPFENTNPFPSRLKHNLAERIIQDLSNNQSNIQIRPTQLQIICSRLWEEYALTRSEITVQEFEEVGGVKGIIEGFLESELAGIKPALRSQAIVILGHLITESGTRDVVGEDRLRKLIAIEEDRGRGREELPSTLIVLEHLEERRVVYKTARRDAHYYELANEYLIQPIQKEVQQLTREKAERRARAEEKARLIRVLGVGLAVVVALMLLILGWAAFTASRQRNIAVEQSNARATAQAQAEADAAARTTAEAKAVAQRDIATSRQLAAQALTRLDDQLDLALLLSLKAYQTDNTLEARSSLLTGLEHSPHLTTFLRGHTDWVRSVAFSPDGQTLASGSADGTVILWDVATGQPIGQPLTEHTAEVWSVAFSPDGQTLASGSADHTIILWDVATGQPIGQLLTGHTAEVWSVAFSPDGQTLASGSADNTIILWNVTTGQPIGQPLTGHSGSVFSVAFSPDGQTLASGSEDNTIILWDVAARQPLGQPLTSHTDAVLSVAFSPDDQTLASGSVDKTIILWDVTTGQPIGQPLTGHTNWVLSVAFSPDGQTLASGSADNTIILWDVVARQPLGQPLTGHADWVRSVAFSPDGQTLASGSEDNTIILWDVAARQPLGQPLTGHMAPVRSIAFSPDGQTLASGSVDKTIILWDVTTGQPIGSPLTGHTDWVYSVAFSPDGQTLASGSEDNTIILWDVAAHPPLSQPLTDHMAPVRSVAFSPDGQTLASGSYRTIILWDATTDQPHGQLLSGHTAPVRSVAFSPDGQTLASGSEDNTIVLWDVAAYPPLGQPLISHTDAVLSVAFSPDGQTLASGSYRTIILWDATTGQPLGQPLTVHSDWVHSVAFSPDGQTLASGSADNTIILWDVVARQPLGQPLTVHSDWVHSVAFSPDGQTLASASADKTIILWDVSFESWQARACRIANRNLTQAEWNQLIGPDIPYERTCPDLPPGEAAPPASPELPIIPSPTSTPVTPIAIPVSPTVTPVTLTPTKTPTQTPVPPTATATHTPGPAATPPLTATATHTPRPTATPTSTATHTPRPPTPTPGPTVPQPASPITLTIYLRDTRTETGFAALSGDQVNGGMIYEEGRFVYGEAAVQIGDTVYHFDKPEVEPGEPEQLPDPWRVEFEFVKELVARTGNQAGFNPKKVQFWVGTLDGNSAVGEDNPYSLTMKLYEGNELRESIQVFFTVADSPESPGGGGGGKPPPPP